MKTDRYHRTTRRVLVLFSLCVLYGALAPLARGDQSFTLRIPDRSPGSPTARVKLTLTTTYDPSGIPGSPAATLAINNGTPLQLQNGFQALGNGDLIKFRRVDAQTVYLELDPWSTIQGAPTDLTKKNPATAFPVDYNMNLLGPGINGYRISSYQAVSPYISNLGVRRVAANEALITTSLPGGKLGRQPIDVVLVLDKSGSMASPPPSASGPPSKWTILHDSVSQFVQLWQTDPGGPTGTPSAHDRLAFVSFDTLPAKQNDFLERGADGSAWNAILTTVGGLGPGGFTCLGGGLKTALGLWLASDLNDRTIVLMTDGMENQSPEVQNTPPLAGLPTPPGAQAAYYLEGDSQPLGAYGAPILTVGVGAPGTIDSGLLDGIAQQTAGTDVQTIDLQGFENALVDGLVGALKGNTLSLVSRDSGQMAPGASSGPAVPVQLDRSVRRAVFLLSWTGPSRALDLQITPPIVGSGAMTHGPVSPVVQRFDGPSWTLQAVDLGATNSIGQWTVQAVRVLREGDRPATPYQISVYAYEAHLDFRLGFVGVSQAAGDDLILTAEISYDGKPLTGLKNGIQARLLAPGEGLGNILHDTTVPSSALTNPPAASDPQSAAANKIAYLIQQSNLLAKIAGTLQPGVLTFTDDGSAAGGDVKANDGVYSARLRDTSKPGKYRFEVTLDWDTPLTGKVRRIEALECQVRVRPDAGASTINAGQGQVTVVPRDRLGNYLGPSYGARIGVSVGGTTIPSPQIGDPNQTGDYHISLGRIAPGTDPIVVITVEGSLLASNKLSKINHQGAPGGCTCCTTLHATVSTAIVACLGIVGILVCRPRRNQST